MLSVLIHATLGPLAYIAGKRSMATTAGDHILANQVETRVRIKVFLRPGMETQVQNSSKYSNKQEWVEIVLMHVAAVVISITARMF